MRWIFLLLENADTEVATFCMLTQFSTQSIVYDAQASNSFQRIHVSLQFSNIGLCSIKGMFLPLENTDR
jgi:hypothetical protein